jgi:hypothetical protein
MNNISQNILSDAFLILGKKMYENNGDDKDFQFKNENENDKNFKIEEYIKKYTSELDNQITFLKKEINNLEYEIDELEKKHIFLFSNIIKNKNFKIQKSYKLFKFSQTNILNKNDLLEYEKYRLNQIVIDKLKNDKDKLIKILENTKSYRDKYN